MRRMFIGITISVLHANDGDDDTDEDDAADDTDDDDDDDDDGVMTHACAMMASKGAVNGHPA